MSHKKNPQGPSNESSSLPRVKITRRSLFHRDEEDYDDNPFESAHTQAHISSTARDISQTLASSSTSSPSPPTTSNVLQSRRRLLNIPSTSTFARASSRHHPAISPPVDVAPTTSVVAGSSPLASSFPSTSSSSPTLLHSASSSSSSDLTMLPTDISSLTTHSPPSQPQSVFAPHTSLLPSAQTSHSALSAHTHTSSPLLYATPSPSLSPPLGHVRASPLDTFSGLTTGGSVGSRATGADSSSSSSSFYCSSSRTYSSAHSHTQRSTPIPIPALQVPITQQRYTAEDLRYMTQGLAQGTPSARMHAVKALLEVCIQSPMAIVAADGMGGVMDALATVILEHLSIHLLSSSCSEHNSSGDGYLNDGSRKNQSRDFEKTQRIPDIPDLSFRGEQVLLQAATAPYMNDNIQTFPLYNDDVSPLPPNSPPLSSGLSKASSTLAILSPLHRFHSPHCLSPILWMYLAAYIALTTAAPTTTTTTTTPSNNTTLPSSATTLDTRANMDTTISALDTNTNTNSTTSALTSASTPSPPQPSTSPPSTTISSQLPSTLHATSTSPPEPAAAAATVAPVPARVLRSAGPSLNLLAAISSGIIHADDRLSNSTATRVDDKDIWSMRKVTGAKTCADKTTGMGTCGGGGSMLSNYWAAHTCTCADSYIPAEQAFFPRAYTQSRARAQEQAYLSRTQGQTHTQLSPNDEEWRREGSGDALTPRTTATSAAMCIDTGTDMMSTIQKMADDSISKIRDWQKKSEQVRYKQQEQDMPDENGTSSEFPQSGMFDNSGKNPPISRDYNVTAGLLRRKRTSVFSESNQSASSSTGKSIFGKSSSGSLKSGEIESGIHPSGEMSNFHDNAAPLSSPGIGSDVRRRSRNSTSNIGSFHSDGYLPRGDNFRKDTNPDSCSNCRKMNWWSILSGNTFLQGELRKKSEIPTLRDNQNSGNVFLRHFSLRKAALWCLGASIGIDMSLISLPLPPTSTGMGTDGNMNTNMGKGMGLSVVMGADTDKVKGASGSTRVDDLRRDGHHDSTESKDRNNSEKREEKRVVLGKNEPMMEPIEAVVQSISTIAAYNILILIKQTYMKYVLPSFQATIACVTHYTRNIHTIIEKSRQGKNLEFENFLPEDVLSKYMSSENVYYLQHLSHFFLILFSRVSSSSLQIKIPASYINPAVKIPEMKQELLQINDRIKKIAFGGRGVEKQTEKERKQAGLDREEVRREHSGDVDGANKESLLRTGVKVKRGREEHDDDDYGAVDDGAVDDGDDDGDVRVNTVGEKRVHIEGAGGRAKRKAYRVKARGREDGAMSDSDDDNSGDRSLGRTGSNFGKDDNKSRIEDQEKRPEMSMVIQYCRQYMQQIYENQGGKSGISIFPGVTQGDIEDNEESRILSSLECGICFPECSFRYHSWLGGGSILLWCLIHTFTYSMSLPSTHIDAITNTPLLNTTTATTTNTTKTDVPNLHVEMPDMGDTTQPPQRNYHENWEKLRLAILKIRNTPKTQEFPSFSVIKDQSPILLLVSTVCQMIEIYSKLAILYTEPLLMDIRAMSTSSWPSPLITSSFSSSSSSLSAASSPASEINLAGGNHTCTPVAALHNYRTYTRPLLEYLTHTLCATLSLLPPLLHHQISACDTLLTRIPAPKIRNPQELRKNLNSGGLSLSLSTSLSFPPPPSSSSVSSASALVPSDPLPFSLFLPPHRHIYTIVSILSYATATLQHLPLALKHDTAIIQQYPKRSLSKNQTTLRENICFSGLLKENGIFSLYTRICDGCISVFGTILEETSMVIPENIPISPNNRPDEIPRDKKDTYTSMTIGRTNCRHAVVNPLDGIVTSLHTYTYHNIRDASDTGTGTHDGTSTGTGMSASTSVGACAVTGGGGMDHEEGRGGESDQEEEGLVHATEGGMEKQKKEDIEGEEQVENREDVDLFDLMLSSIDMDIEDTPYQEKSQKKSGNTQPRGNVQKTTFSPRRTLESRSALDFFGNYDNKNECHVGNADMGIIEKREMTTIPELLLFLISQLNFPDRNNPYHPHILNSEREHGLNTLREGSSGEGDNGGVDRHDDDAGGIIVGGAGLGVRADEDVGGGTYGKEGLRDMSRDLPGNGSCGNTSKMDEGASNIEDIPLETYTHHTNTLCIAHCSQRNTCFTSQFSEFMEIFGKRETPDLSRLLMLEWWNIWQKRFHCQLCVCLGYIISRNPTIIYTIFPALRIQRMKEHQELADFPKDESLNTPRVDPGRSLGLGNYNIRNFPLSAVTLQPLLSGMETYLAAQAIISQGFSDPASGKSKFSGIARFRETSDILSGVYLICERFERLRLRLMDLWGYSRISDESSFLKDKNSDDYHEGEVYSHICDGGSVAYGDKRSGGFGDDISGQKGSHDRHREDVGRRCGGGSGLSNGNGYGGDGDGVGGRAGEEGEIGAWVRTCVEEIQKISLQERKRQE